MRYRCVEKYRCRYPIRMMCRLLPLGVSGDYAWRSRRPRRRSQVNEGLKRAITRIHRHSGAVYGSPKIRRILLAQGQTVGRHRVARLMRALRLRGRPYPRKKPRTRARGTEPSAKNLLNQEVQAPAPNPRWVSDITDIRTGEGWLYLAAIRDLYSRRMVGGSLGQRLTTSLAIQAFERARRRRRPPPGLLYHSDRGTQYTRHAFQSLRRQHGVRCSLSAKGNGFDNAAMESFFAWLKRERVTRPRYLTRKPARTDIFDDIERFYNRQRSHHFTGGLSPLEFESRALNSTVHFLGAIPPGRNSRKSLGWGKRN